MRVGYQQGAGEEDVRMATVAKAMTSDELAKLATEMAELSDRICRLEDLGKSAPRGTIRGLKSRLDILRSMMGGGVAS
jgi:hypothetical protein